MKLIVVEKPSVAKTIRKYLDSEYEIVAISGHIRETRYERGICKNPWKKVALSTLVKTPLELVPTTQNTAKAGYLRLKRALAKNYDEIILALDPDVQGYTMSHDIWQLLSKDVAIFTADLEALDRAGVCRAMAEKTSYQDRGVSGDVKRRVDFLIGTIMTRCVSLKNQMANSKWFTYTVGRVQSIALKFIRDRLEEHEKFVPELKKRLWLDDIKLPWFESEGPKSVDLRVIEKKEKKVGPFPGYNTDSLVSTLSRHPTFTQNPTRIVKELEKLYLRGEISYPRTDNPDYSNYRDLLYAGSRIFEAQTGNKPIIPFLRPKKLSDHGPITILRGHNSEDSLQAKTIKQVLLKRCSQIYSGSNEYQVSTLEISNPIYGTTTHDLWISLIKRFEDNRTSYPTMPVFSNEMLVKEEWTRPPFRYNFGSLIQKMASEGIGTKSTRSKIIETLVSRRYIYSIRGAPYVLTYYARRLLEELANSFVLNSKFTQELEKSSEGVCREKMLEVEQRYRKNLEDFLKTYLKGVEQSWS